MRVFRHQKWFWLAAASLVSCLTAFWTIDVDFAQHDAIPHRAPMPPLLEMQGSSDMTADLIVPQGFREKVEARDRRLEWTADEEIVPIEPLISEVIPASFTAPQKPEVPPAVWLSGGIETVPESSSR